MIKRSEMCPFGGATFWDNHLPAVTTILTPVLVCLKPKILPKNSQLSKKKLKTLRSVGLRPPLLRFRLLPTPAEIHVTLIKFDQNIKFYAISRLESIQ